MVYERKSTQPITPIKYTGLTFNIRGLDITEQKRMQEIADRTTCRLQEIREIETEMHGLYTQRESQKRFVKPIILSPFETYAQMDGRS